MTSSNSAWPGVLAFALGAVAYVFLGLNDHALPARLGNFTAAGICVIVALVLVGVPRRT